MNIPLGGPDDDAAQRFRGLTFQFRLQQRHDPREQVGGHNQFAQEVFARFETLAHKAHTVLKLMDQGGGSLPRLKPFLCRLHDLIFIKGRQCFGQGLFHKQPPVQSENRCP